MKKIILLVLVVFSFTFVNAQKSDGTNWLKFGAHAGIPVGDIGKVSSFMLGGDVKYQLLGLDSFGIGVASGYSNYFGSKKGNTSENYPSFGVLPLAGLFRYYATSSFFIGTDLGYAFLMVEGDNSSGTNGGFYYRPEVGYHNEKWNVYAFYQGISKDNSSVASVGIGVSYNIVRREK